MISIRISIRKSGTIGAVVSHGHAAFSGGSSIPCAVVSASLKGFGKILVGMKSLHVTGRTDGPGDFSLHIGSVPDDAYEQFIGVQALFLELIEDIARAYPDEVRLITEEREEAEHGT